MEKQLEAAIKEINKLREKYDALYREFGMMKLYASDLEEQIKSFNIKKSQKGIDQLMEESKAAMKRYTAKLRKESENYAKQKQS